MVSIRQLLIVVFLLIAFWLYKRFQQRLRTTRLANKFRRRVARFEEMVMCAHCNIHVPRSRAVAGSQNQYFCCSEHQADFLVKHDKG
jgi:hypothetical protein